MHDLEFKQIIEIDDYNLDIMTNWLYNWWGQEDGYTFESLRNYLENTFQENILPKTYGLFIDGKIIGMFQFTYEDLEVRPDIYPWLANLYVDKEYRNKGIARLLLKKILEIAASSVSHDELYLYTKHIGLYEKFGWDFVSEIDTEIKTPRLQRLYRLDLKSIEENI